MKTKTMLLLALCLVTQTIFAGENTVLKTKKHFQVSPNAAHDALIIKSNESGVVKIVDENGNVSYEQNVKQGVNEIHMKNVSRAKYKLIFNSETNQIIKNLLIQ